jgi:hypothetical protein
MRVKRVQGKGGSPASGSHAVRGRRKAGPFSRSGKIPKVPW